MTTNKANNQVKRSSIQISKGKPTGRGLQLNPVITALRETFASPGKSPVVTPDYLRLESEITGSSSIRFNFGKAEGSRTITETRLDENDYFFATGMRFFLKKVNTLKHSTAVLQTYPNPFVFANDTGGGASAFNCEHLEAIYHGSFKLQTDQSVQIERLPVLGFRNVPAAQEGMITAVNSHTAGAGTANRETFPLSDSAFTNSMSFMNDFGIHFSGAKRHSLELVLPEDTDLDIRNTVANMSNWAVVIFDGYIVKGGAVK